MKPVIKIFYAFLVAGLFLFVLSGISHGQDCFKSVFSTSDIDLSGQLENGKISMKKTAIIKVHIRNGGLCVWEPYDITLRVRVVGSPSGASSYSLQDLVPGNGGTLPLKNRVMPKDDIDFFYEIKMDDPKTVSGEYKLRFQLYAKGKAFDNYVDKELPVNNPFKEEGDCKMMANISASNVKMPAKIFSGKKIPVSIGVDNTGTCRWEMDRGKVELKITCISWPDIGAGEKEKLTPDGDNYLTAYTASDIESGHQADFNYTLTGPSAPGTYKLEMQMTNQRKPFGPRFLREIVVTGDPKRCDVDARMEVVSFPSEMFYLKEYPVTVKVTNMGQCDWTADTRIEIRCKLLGKPSGSPHELPSLIPESGVWALGSKIVRPGETFEIRYKAKGPYVTGSYGIQWTVFTKNATTSTEVTKSFKVSIPKD